MDRVIEEFIGFKDVAVVGVSDKKFGGAIYKTLKQRGYNVCPVHPSRESFDGDKCYPDLQSLPPDVNAAVLAVSPDTAHTIVETAAGSGITHIWFQQGKDFSKAVTVAEENGLHTVSRKCILMYAEPVTGIHSFHRFLAKLFGKL